MLAHSMLVFILVSITSCVSTKSANPTQSSPVKMEPKAPKKVEIPCYELNGKLKKLPAFVGEKSIMVNEFLKDCTTKSGELGYQIGSSWTAMGFPCTGGRGAVDWKGSIYAPKNVSFMFSNNCPMAFKERGEIEEQLREILDIPEKSNLIAYYPFSVVYWEITGFIDRDVGNKVELFSSAARKEAWNRFQANKPVNVTLFGRENAFVRTKHFYRVDGEIQKDGEEDFMFVVNQVEVLNKAQIDEVKKRCKKIKPRRDCDKLLSI